MNCTADPPQTRLNSSGSGQLNRGCSQVICLQREKHTRWNPLFSNFLFFPGGRWRLAGHSPSSMTHIHSPLIITVVFPWGDSKVSSFFFGWELITGHLLFPTPGSLFSRFFPYFAHSRSSGFSLNHTLLKDCLPLKHTPATADLAGSTTQLPREGAMLTELLLQGPWGHKESAWLSERALTHTHTHTHTHTRQELDPMPGPWQQRTKRIH